MKLLRLICLSAVLVLSAGLMGCGGNPLVQTAEDGTEVRFDDLQGSIEYSHAVIIGISRATGEAYKSGAMSFETASKIKDGLQKSRDGLIEAANLRMLGDIEGATLELKTAKLLLNASKEVLKRSGVDLSEAQL